MSAGVWFYAGSDGAVGPIEREQLESLIERGEVRQDTLVWTEGMEDWMPAGQLALFEQALHKEEPPAPSPEVIQKPRATLRPSQPDPARRFVARTLDQLIFQYVVLQVVGGLDPTTPNLVWWMAGVYLLWALIEGVLIATLGSTPAKWFMQIEVTDPFGRRLDLVRSLRRSFDVSIRGVALGYPIAHTFAQLYGLYQLVNRGITPWDRSAGVVVTHRPIDAMRWIAAVLLMFWLMQSAAGLLQTP